MTTNRGNLPAKAAAQYISLSSDQCNSLVARGLEAIKQKRSIVPPQGQPKIDTEEETEVLINQLQPQAHHVTGVNYYRHEKEGKPDTLRVDYLCGLNTYREWLLFTDLEPRDFPPDKMHTWLQFLEKSRLWWIRRSEKQAPNTVTEALNRTGELKMPKIVKVRKVLKYHEVVGYEF